MTDHPTDHSVVDLTSVTALFQEQLSERSGLVRPGEHLQVLREYETVTTTKFSCYKASQGFGNTGKSEAVSMYVVDD